MRCMRHCGLTPKANRIAKTCCRLECFFIPCWRKWVSSHFRGVQAYFVAYSWSDRFEVGKKSLSCAAQSSIQ